MALPGDLGKLQNSPDFALQLAVGPPSPTLVPQQPGTGICVTGAWVQQAHRYLFKKAHLSADDYRIFDHATGQPVAVMHHFGKNPYQSLDPLGVSYQSNAPLGEWDSITNITGYHGMPALKIRPKAMSRHGRQLIMEHGSNRTLFNVAKQSRFKTMSVRHNMQIGKGEEEEATYTILCDLVGRTMNIVNEREETCIFIQKSMQTMIKNAALGAGSELIIDVAPGVDWTAAVAIVLAIQQVGAHWAKDAVSNWVVSPLQNQAIDEAATLTGTSGLLGKFTGATNDATRWAQLAQRVQHEFFA